MVTASEKKPSSYVSATSSNRQGWAHLSVCCYDELPTAMNAVLSAMRDHHFSSRDEFAVRMALTESVVNALRHGHRNDCSKVVQLRTLVTHDQLWIEVEDEGNGFDPDSIPDPRTDQHQTQWNGRGLFLMRATMDRIDYNRRGNRVLMFKRRESI